VTELSENSQNPESESLVIYLKPAKGWLSIDFKELWRYRELIYFLAWRDIKVRYKQAVLGITWAVLQPLMTMVIFTVIFGTLLNTPSQGIPYPLFSLTALLPWQLFASALQRSSVSLVGNANLLTKIYFPRLAIPLASIFAALVDFLISFVVLIGVMVYYHYSPGWNALWLPLLVLLALLTALAVGHLLSAGKWKTCNDSHTQAAFEKASNSIFSLARATMGREELDYAAIVTAIRTTDGPLASTPI